MAVSSLDTQSSPLQHTYWVGGCPIMLVVPLTGCEEECLLRLQVVHFTQSVTCQLRQEDVQSNHLIPDDTTLYCCGFVHLFLGDLFIVLVCPTAITNFHHLPLAFPKNKCGFLGFSAICIEGSCCHFRWTYCFHLCGDWISFSVHLNQFHLPEDGSSMFLRNFSREFHHFVWKPNKQLSFEQ